MQRINGTLNFIKENVFIITALIIILIGGVSYYFYSNNVKANNIETYTVKRKTISEGVEVSGQVSAASDLSLSFEKSGTISSINYKEGDKVLAGSIIMSLSSADSAARVREADASVQAQQAQLDQLLGGATDAERNIKLQNLANAKSDLDIASAQATDTVNNIKNSINNIIGYTLSSLFTKTNNAYTLTFSSCDQSAQNIIEVKRSQFDTITFDDLDGAKNVLDKTNDYVASINNLVNLPCSSADASLSDERLAAATAKTSLTTLYTEIAARRTQLQSASNAISRAQKDLDLTNEGVDKNKIDFQRSQLNAAQARLAQARVEANKNNIISPVNGIIVSIDADVGESVSLGKSVVRVITDGALEIKADISENDIAKLKIGNKATITLDAYPLTSFAATVSSIEPAATTISGVPRYGITLTFDKNYDEIKVGMTAGADIVTSTKDNVITVPSEYIKIKGGKGEVKRRINNNGDKSDVKSETIVVSIGIRDNQGNIEITEGLNEGDVLVK